MDGHCSQVLDPDLANCSHVIASIARKELDPEGWWPTTMDIHQSLQGRVKQASQCIQNDEIALLTKAC
jgi:hypothetical protein